jgi:hypothetical protein
VFWQWLLASGLEAKRHSQSAEKNAALARAEGARIAEVAGKLHDQLRQASWTSFNQAERQFQLGEWREGIALLARAIKFDPENPVASERFFQELIVHREKALPLPIASFAHQDAVESVAFSPECSASYLDRRAETKLPSSGMRLQARPSPLLCPSGSRLPGGV